jgi:hypothetical protein
MTSYSRDDPVMPRPAPPRPRGRPRENPLPRQEQLRLAKRAQRARDRAAGRVLCQVKLGPAVAERLRHALVLPGFEARLAQFLAEELIDVREYPELALLCWNRADRFLSAREAFALYERNWRFVDAARLSARERDLVDRLVQRYGNGVLNA